MTSNEAAIYLNGYNAAKREGEERLDRAVTYAAELLLKCEHEKEQLESEVKTVRNLLKSTTVEHEKYRKAVDTSISGLIRTLLDGYSPCAFCTMPCTLDSPFRASSLFPTRALCDKNSKYYMFQYKSGSLGEDIGGENI